LVGQIVDDDFEIDVLVPQGASPESFEMTPKQYASLQNSTLIFEVGLLDFEHNLLRNFSDAKRITNLSIGISPLEGSCSHHHHSSATTSTQESDGHVHGVDPHIWMSPKSLKIMAKNAYDAIHRMWSDSTRYTSNYHRLVQRIDTLDVRCAELIQQCGLHTFVIYHPALSYYAQDYHIEQLAVEHEGKEPSALYLSRLIEQAKAKGVRQVLYQAQYPASAVQVIAEDMQASLVEMNPLREDVLANIEEITQKLCAKDE
jgi:zinc transport system substrate-binding protein